MTADITKIKEAQEPVAQEVEDPMKYFKRYSKTLMITAGCRFEAARRLEKKDGVSAVAISILSLYAIAFSLSPYFLDKKILDSLTYLPFASVIISIFIIILTLLEASKKYSVRAELMHQCGKALNELHYELDYLINTNKINSDNFYEIKKSYDKVIKNFPENHEQLDFHYYRVTNHRVFYSPKPKNIVHSFLKWLYKKMEKIWINILHIADSWGFYLSLMIVPVAIVGTQLFLKDI